MRISVCASATEWEQPRLFSVGGASSPSTWTSNVVVIEQSSLAG